MYKKCFKRLLDIVLSFVAIILLSPIYLIISIFVFVFMGWPIIFKQKRPGKDEKIFSMYKFRTMNNKKDKNGKLLQDRDRLTKFGVFLRKTSLDELPELFCILVGKMSIVGPRPLLVEYLPYYTEEEHHRHDVRPGLTGLAQTSGRNTISWEEKFKYDIEYVNNISFKNDILILIKKIKVVLNSEGINQSSNETMENFAEYRKRRNKR